MKAQILVLSTILILSGPAMNLPFSSSANATKDGISSEARHCEQSEAKNRSIDFAFFRTHRQAIGAVATWGLTSNENVTGFDLQRTYQDPTDPYSIWEDVTYVSCTEERSFKYSDAGVMAGYIYYRVIAYMNDGSSVISEVSGIRIVDHK